MHFTIEDNALVCRSRGETLRVEAWGRDSLRVRAAMGSVGGPDWALTETPERTRALVTVEQEDHWVGDGTTDKREYGKIVNGRVSAVG